MIIKFFTNWCSSTFIKEVTERICEVDKLEWYGVDKQVYITDGDDYTHVIILNTAMPVIKPGIPKENVIGISHEPHYFLGLTGQFLQYAEKNIHKYHIGEILTNLPKCFIAGKLYLTYITPLTYIPVKTNLMSIMVSKKKSAPGHKYRHTLVTNLLKHNFPIDIYGNGCSYFNSGNQRLKGEFKELEPYESYKFHIAIENYQTEYYYSEKIMNCLLCGTTPVYLGCKNIETFFPDNAIIMTGNIVDDLNLLYNIVVNPDKFIKSIDVDAVKNKINVLKHLDELF